MKKNFYFILLLATFVIGCGHSQSCKIGLMSFGELEGKVIPDNIDGRIFEGKDCGYQYFLSDAVRDALKETEYDTLVDVEVTTKTGLLVPSNCIIVEGTALNSKTLTDSGGR